MGAEIARQRQRRAPVSPWTDDRIAYVRARWVQGATARQISVELDGCISRSAVLGIVYRLRLSDLALALAMRQQGKGATTDAVDAEDTEYAKAVEPGLLPLGWRRPGAQRKPPPWIVNAAPHVEAPSIDTDIPISQRRSLGELSEHTCRWPVGDPLGTDFFFCGAPPVPDEPYCAAHCARAYQSPRDTTLRGPGSQRPRRRRPRALPEHRVDSMLAGLDEATVKEIERETT
jgi:GcrA cell cycle regulator